MHWYYYKAHLPWVLSKLPLIHKVVLSVPCSCRSAGTPGVVNDGPENSVRSTRGPKGRGRLYHQRSSTPRTGLEMGLPSKMPVQVCVAVGRGMRLCARLCQCVNEWMCLSVSSSAWCMSTMACCFAVPPLPPLSKPRSPLRPSNPATYFLFFFSLFFIRPLYCAVRLWVWLKLFECGQ